MQLAHRYAALLTAPDGILREAPADEAAEEKSELELQAHWFAGDFGSSFLTATNGERVEIVQYGVWNHEAGPDFAAAAVRFPDRPDSPVLRGAIELDMQAYDWERHGHGTNPAFDEVVLHLYLRQGADQAFTRNSARRQVAQVQLDLRQLEHRPVPAGLPLAKAGRCQAPLRDLDDAQVRTVLSAAAQYRMDSKNRRWQGLAAVRGYDQALFQSLAITLGYKENKLPFALLAQRLPLATLRADPAAAAAGNGTRRVRGCARQDAWHGGRGARPPRETPNEPAAEVLFLSGARVQGAEMPLHDCVGLGGERTEFAVRT
jgi:hypothetical protein